VPHARAQFGDTSNKRRADGLPSLAAAEPVTTTSAHTTATPTTATPAPADPPPPWAELAVTSNYTFLTGASHPDELVHAAAALGYRAIAITDLHSLAGVVRAHVAAKEAGIQLIVGARVNVPLPPDAAEPCPPGSTLGLLLYPTCVRSYAALCQLLTLGKSRAPKGQCHLTLHDVLHAANTDDGRNLEFVLCPPLWPADTPPGQWLPDLLRDLLHALGGSTADRLSLAVARHYHAGERARLRQLADLSADSGVPLLAVGDVLYHTPERRALQDVLTAIRHGLTLQQCGTLLHASAERHLKPPAELHRLFAHAPAAIARALALAQRCAGFSMDMLRYQYPAEVVPLGRTAMAHLTDLTWAGAAQRYPAGVSDKLRRQLTHELTLIDQLNYAHYFLTVHDIVTFARSKGILCQGRGAAANSAVCFCLGVTAVDPERIDVLFERFISRERNEPPDIDIDFEHERREEVIQYLYAKYGRDRAALTAEVITYRGRSAAREVGKALGLSVDAVDAIAKNIDWWEPGVPQHHRLREVGLNPDDPVIRRLLALVPQILGFPRHLSQHVGGFVITQRPLSELVPIEPAAMPDRTVIQWDKDDIDAMGMLKVDVLGLGMLTVIAKAMHTVSRQTQPADAPPLTLATIPPEDPAVYDMICAADTVGVFQIESRAQMAMLPRLRPRCFYDLVIEVAIVRPGPIQGDMVHPYLRRRDGLEPVSFPDDKVRAVLGKTLGVPLFQEQAMALAIVAAGFTPDEADQLRRAIAAWKTRQKVIYHFGRKIITGMTQRGYPLEFAQRCFEQIKGFSEYGFPESHAASFALLVYASAWIKRHHPAHFAAALINSQPMGFYAPAQILRDAADHGVVVLPIDANCSQFDCTVDAHGRLRLGLRLIAGLPEAHVRALCAARPQGGYPSVTALWRSSRLPVSALRQLAQADAFGSLGLDRQRALWAVDELHDEPLPLFAHLDTALPDSTPPPAPTATPASTPALPRLSPAEQVVRDYRATGLSLKDHPVAFMRPALLGAGARPCSFLRDPACTHGTHLAVAGLVLLRQRPSTAKGVMFITLEDESGVANLIVHHHVYLRHRAAARHAGVLLARGVVQRQGQIVHLLVRSLREMRAPLAVPSRDFR